MNLCVSWERPRSSDSSSENPSLPELSEDEGPGLQRGVLRLRTWSLAPAELLLFLHRRMGRAQASHFHSVRLLCWAWSKWREVRLWHGHSLSVAFGQVELFVCVTQSRQMVTSIYMPLDKGYSEALPTVAAQGPLCARLLIT